MTTEPADSASRRLPVNGIATALVLWFVGMTLAALVVQPTAVVAFGDPRRLAQVAITDQADLLNAGPMFLAVRPDNRATVRHLYAGGAWLVWPVLSAGCFGRSR